MAICNKPCQNGGKCTAPNYCSCPKTHEGDQCELLICNTATDILNSERNCTLRKCKVTCNEGYFLDDGSDTVQIVCEQGKFVLAPNQHHDTIPSACQRKIHL